MITSKTHTVPRPSVLAMGILDPLLNDSYDEKPEGDFTSYIKQALVEIESKLIPVPAERLQQIISRLMMHFQSSNQEYINLEFSALLKRYPEDLLCAAYHYILTHYSNKSMPGVYEFLNFMAPEMQRRETLHRKLIALSNRVSEEVTA